VSGSAVAKAAGSPAYRLVFGLSADPVHVGHVEMVTESARSLVERGYRLDQILLVPVYRRNPVGANKAGLPESYHHRFVMCGLASGDIARRLGLSPAMVRPSDIEASLARHHTRPNYTAETLLALRLRSGPGVGLIFLISSELVAGPTPQFARWYRPDAILKYATLAICPRPGYEPNRRYLQALLAQGADVVLMPEVATPDISATELRARLREGQSPLALAYRGVLLPSVARYIAERNLYTESPKHSL
jgi:nicotinate (nicotinamide) nucleotide adenylyltransferase